MDNRGQALIESIPYVLIFAGFAGALFLFSEWFLIRQKLLLVAREGAMLYSSGHMTRQAVRRRMMHELTQGSPKLSAEGIAIVVGRAEGWQAHVFFLDRIGIQYRLRGSLLRYFTPTLEESCTIKHAPHYGPPFQTILGPPVKW